ncbi:MAG: hydrogenase maturation protease [Proteobacteria bacterium]|nr:hydrogenase maturation protease [Pseudomonadota bacterium]
MEKEKHERDKKGVIVGVGNVLQKDDGIGIKVLKYLEAAYVFPDHVDLVDGGTAGAALQSEILGKDWLLIIDALDVSGQPGDIRMIAGNDILCRPADLKMSPHQVGFFDLIQLMELNDQGVEEFSILGIIPKDTGVGTELSIEVEASLDPAVAKVMAWLHEKGIAPKKVEGSVKPDYWWTR